MKILCRFCDKEYLIQENEGEKVAREVIDHIIEKHPEHGSELKLRLQTATKGILGDYVIFQKK